MKALIRLSILLLFILSGCKKEDLIPPGEVTNLSADYNGTTIILTWSDPVDPDLDSIQILFRKDSMKVGKGVQLIEFPGLKYERDYEFAFITYDVAGNHSAGIRIKCRIEDLIPPSEVTNLSATYSLMTILLQWTPPRDIDFTKVEISYDDTLMVLKKRDTTIVIPIFEREREYLFTLKTIDWNGNKSNGKQIICSTYDYRLPFTGTFSFLSIHSGYFSLPPSSWSDTVTYIGNVSVIPSNDSLIQIRYREDGNDNKCGERSIYGTRVEPLLKTNGILSLYYVQGCLAAWARSGGSYVNPDSIHLELTTGGHAGGGGLKLSGKRIN